MGETWGRRRAQRETGNAGGAGNKIENEHKKHKKRGAGQIAVEHSSAKGQFIFVCYINFLLRLLASAVSSLSAPAALRSQPPTSDRVSSLKTVNSARHQGECELAPAVLSAPIKMTMKKTGSVSSVVSPIPTSLPPVLPIESYLNGSYALIDPFRRLKVSRSKDWARGVYGGRS